MKAYKLLVLTTLLFYITSASGQELSMFRGFWGTTYYEDDSQISKQQFESLLLKDSEAHQMWQKSKLHMTITRAATVAQVGFLLWQLNRARNFDSQTVPFIGLLGSAGVALGFGPSAYNLKKKAILKYNSNADVGALKIGPTYNGIGLVLSF